MIKRKLVTASAIAIAASLSFGTAGAGAAHCVEGDSPGFSYFGSEFVQEHENDRGSFDGRTKGASACREATGSPSERAPGQSR